MSLTRLRLGLSHLPEHKFEHSFQDSINPLCKGGYEVVSTCNLFYQLRHVIRYF